MSTAIVFSYGDMGTAAFAALGEAGAQVLALVLPSNRVGHDVEIARTAARAAGLPYGSSLPGTASIRSSVSSRPWPRTPS